MSQWDDNQDPWNEPYTGDGGGPQAPPVGDPFITGLNALYQQYYGRDATGAEVAAHRGNPNGLTGVEAMLKASQAPTPGDPNPTTPTEPPAPPPTGGGDGGSAPPPTGTATAPPAPINSPPPSAPPVVTPPAFSFEDWTPTTGANVLDDKQYQFDREQGLSAIGASRAAAGTLNTGGTLKDYLGFATNLANTKFGDIDSRRRTDYATRRGNALDTYNTNYGTQYKDPWTEQYQNAQLGQNNDQFNSTMNFNKWLEDYKQSVMDPFDFRYKTLGLLK